MDFGGSFDVLWRRKGLTFALLLLTLLGTACAGAILPWQYTASITETLLNSEQSSATLGGGNPYLSFDSSMVDMADFLALQLADGPNTLALRQNGYTASFQAQVLSENPEVQEPFIQISVTGSDKETVARTLQGVTASLSALLTKVQAGVPAQSRLTLQTISEVSTPTRSVSSKIKPPVGFLGVGLVLTFLIPQAVEGIAERRRRIRAHDTVQADDQPRSRDRAPTAEPDRFPVGHAAMTRGGNLQQQWPAQQVEDDYRNQRVSPMRPEGREHSRPEYGAPDPESARYPSTERRWLCSSRSANCKEYTLSEGRYCVSVSQLVALARRHILAVCLIALVTAGIAIDFKYTPPQYKETATLVLEPQTFSSVEPVNADDNYLQDSSLIYTSLLLVMHLSSPQGETQFRQAGITGNFSIAVINSYNADSPSYTYPDLSVSVSGRSPGTAHQQFGIAMQVIHANIAEFQTGRQFSNRDRLVAYTLSDGGPISQRGSLARAYAALVFCFLVATFLTCRFLDRRSHAAIAPVVG